ncbi:MAG TPA: response regulator transcription factor [Fontimonas sp.]
MGVCVLIIEDDDDLRDTLSLYLGDAGMDVVGIPDASELERELNRRHVDVIICDINLPGESGFSAAARARVASKAGIVMLTARAQHEDRMLGFTLGADHYMVKPVDLRELEIVIRNLHRRLVVDVAQQAAGDTPMPGRWTFHASLWTLTTPNGRSVQLTLAERHIVACLMEHPGEAVKREELLAVLNRAQIEAYSRNLDVAVSRLRRKVDDLCDEKLPVMPARGVGYVFTGRAHIISGV